MLWAGVGALVLIAVLCIWSKDSAFRRSLSIYDCPEGEHFSFDRTGSKSLEGVIHRLQDVSAYLDELAFFDRLKAVRKAMDSFLSHVEIVSDRRPVNAGGVPAEWVTAPGFDAKKRFLYIHGGAFCAGSPYSHRVITSRLSEVTGCAVLAIDYRLMPEHKRIASVLDCRSAYNWILDYGPDDNDSEVENVFVGGDSAGGNLTLSLIAWIRDSGGRAPDAAVALSPITDMALDAPSIEANRDTDIILKSLFKLINMAPRPLYRLFTRFASGVPNSNPLVSPLLGDLSNLPPTLIQVSESEMLLDDARRYVNKTVASGSIAVLQLWESMPHVFQIFYPELSPATQAFDEIGKFCAKYSSAALKS